MRKQITVQVHSDRHPKLFKRYFTKDGKRKHQYNAAQDITRLANDALSDSGDEQDVLAALARIEQAISKLKSVGLVDDDEEILLNQRATDLLGQIPIMR